MSADLEDFISLDEVAENVTLPDQWPGLIRALKSLGALFDGKVTTGTEPQDILNGLILGDLLGTQRRNWRITTDSTGNLLFQRNTGLQDTPTWTTRLTIDPSTGLGNFAPLVHQHAASDVVSGTFADTRISQSSVDQWGVSVAAANRIVKGKSDGKIDENWISQLSVEQWATATPTANRIPKADASHFFADGWISASSVLQHAKCVILASNVTSATGATAAAVFSGSSPASVVVLPFAIGSVSADCNITMQFSYDGGSSYETSAAYRWAVSGSSQDTAVAGTGFSSSAPLSGSGSVKSAWGPRGILIFTRQGTGSLAFNYSGIHGYLDSASAFHRVVHVNGSVGFSGTPPATGTLNAVKFIADAGSISVSYSAFGLIL